MLLLIKLHKIGLYGFKMYLMVLVLSRSHFLLLPLLNLSDGMIPLVAQWHFTSHHCEDISIYLDSMCMQFNVIMSSNSFTDFLIIRNECLLSVSITYFSMSRMLLGKNGPWGKKPFTECINNLSCHSY